MKALRYYGHEDIRYEDVDEPVAGPGWSLVEVGATSICRSDIKEYHGPLYISGRPNPLTGVSLPVTLGHEFAGRVVEMNGSHESVKEGDRVAVDACIKCGECWYCLHGEYVMCDRLAILGFDAHGSFAPRIAVPNYAMHALPDAVPDDAGSLVEPLSVAMHAFRRGHVGPGDVVAVVGAGMIGLAVLAVARTSGAREVHVIEPKAERRDRALRLGADSVIDPETDAVAAVRSVTASRGADVVFDCVGLQQTLPVAIEMARKNGRVVVVGVPTQELSIDMTSVVVQQKELIGSLCYVDDFPRVISLIADGRIPTNEFITGKIKLHEIIEKGFVALSDDPDLHIRLLVDAQAVQP